VREDLDRDARHTKWNNPKDSPMGSGGFAGTGDVYNNVEEFKKTQNLIMVLELAS
jgi:hypothetical protein